MIAPLTEYSDAEFLIESFSRYVEHKIPTGDFLRAVLENNLVEAVSRADIHNINRLPSIVQYCYENLPHNCWGSKEIVANFLKREPKGENNEANRYPN